MYNNFNLSSIVLSLKISASFDALRSIENVWLQLNNSFIPKSKLFVVPHKQFFQILNFLAQLNKPNDFCEYIKFQC